MEEYQTVLGVFLGVFSLERGVLLALRKRKPLPYDKIGIIVLWLLVILSALTTLGFINIGKKDLLNIFNIPVANFVFQCILFWLTFMGCFPVLEVSYSQGFLYKATNYLDKNYMKVFMFFLFLRLLSSSDFFILFP